MPDNETITSIPQQLPQLSDPFYEDPSWATPTSDEWTLIEIKGGVELSKISLNQRRCWLLGRAEDRVHLPLQHPSISRCHARIAFDKTGIPWLRDCRSTHGVFVNKKRLPPEAVGVDETPHSTKKGARGVVLYPGDVLQLGASTRIYCLEGPEQFQRGRIRIPPPPPPQKQQQPAPATEVVDSDPAKESKQQEAEDAGISWGISMDEAADHQEEESVDEAMKRQQALEQVPEKHRKSYEKIQALKFKLQNIQTENERIRRKGELTQGQENQLKRNSEREQQLGEQILERENELLIKLNPENRTKSKKWSHHHQHVEEDEDVDDFFDRTKDDNANSNSEDGETEESLLAKWKDLQAQQKRKEQLLERAQQKVANLQERLDRLQAAGDEEAFFAQNDFNLAEESKKKVESSQTNIRKELEETKRLLKIVNPGLILEEPKRSSLEEQTDGAIMPPPMLPPPMRKPADAAANPESGMMPPPMMPPPKRKRTVGPSPPPHPVAAAEPTTKDDAVTKPPSSKGKAKGPARPVAVMGTLAALTAVSSSSHDNYASSKPHGSSNNKPENTNKQSATAIDLKKDEWRAPKDQDGSGITKLNAKFAGRY